MLKTRGLQLLLALFCLVHLGLAQSSSGRITGRVSDQTGAVLAGAHVTVVNVATGVSRVLVSSSSGDYAAVNLEPGLYQLTAEADGFACMQHDVVRVEVATSLRMDFALKPGKVSEVIEVKEDDLMIDTTSTTLGGTMTNTAINELPLQGRDFQNLLMLRPGVQRTPGGGILSVTSNGNRANENNYIIDGVDDNDIYYGDTVVNGVGVSGTPATHLPLDAIQEFNSLQNQGAEYGWKPGAVVNIGLKSGTNNLHGTAYYFHRNSMLDARNFFNDADETKSALLLHQYGFSLGGPIRKDKWFYFVNYEGTRDKVGNPGSTSSPVTSSLLAQGADSDTATEYSLPDAESDLGCDAGNCNALSLKLAQLFLTNKGNVSNADPSLIDFDFNNTNREDNVVVKSDYHLNERHSFAARYFYGNSHQVEEDSMVLRPEFLSFSNTHVGVGGGGWSWTPTSNWFNQLRFGVNTYWQYVNALDSNKDAATTYGINTGITGTYYGGLPEIDISPFDSLGGNYNWPLRTTPNHTYQLSDNATWLHGRHNVQFGGEYRTGGTDNLRARNGRGRIRFRSLEDFLSGDVYRAYILTGDPHRNVSMTAAGGYVRDDWRINSKLTINAGLRYDYTGPISEEHNELANFVPSKGLVQVGHGIGSAYDVQKSNFGPRLGFAWDVTGKASTVLRAGTSLIFEQPSIRTFIDRAGLGINPSGAAGVTPGGGTMNTVSRTLHASGVTWSEDAAVFDTSSSSLASCSIDNACDVFGVKPDLKTPRVWSWNLNLQQKLTSSMMIEIAYVGNRGMDLYSHRDLNQVDPTLDDGSEQLGRPYTYACPVSEGGGGGTGYCYPWAEYVFYLENMGSSIYHGLQVTLTQKSWHGWDFLAGYTFAHSIDTGSSDRSGYPQDSNNFKALRGNADSDIRHRVTISTTYNLPSIKAPLQMLKGWQLTSILMLEGGEPFDLYDSVDDISETGTYGNEHWNFHGNAHDVHAGLKPIPQYFSSSECEKYASADDISYYGCYIMGSAVITPQTAGTFGNMGRNIFRGPKFTNWDLSASKRWSLRGNMTAQLRAEFFNLPNHPNLDVATMDTDLAYGTPGELQFTPDVGASNPVIGSGGSRHIQLGAKIVW